MSGVSFEVSKSKVESQLRIMPIPQYLLPTTEAFTESVKRSSFQISTPNRPTKPWRGAFCLDEKCEQNGVYSYVELASCSCTLEAHCVTIRCWCSRLNLSFTVVCIYYECSYMCCTKDDMMVILIFLTYKYVYNIYIFLNNE